MSPKNHKPGDGPQLVGVHRQRRKPATVPDLPSNEALFVAAWNGGDQRAAELLAAAMAAEKAKDDRAREDAAVAIRSYAETLNDARPVELKGTIDGVPVEDGRKRGTGPGRTQAVVTEHGDGTFSVLRRAVYDDRIARVRDWADYFYTGVRLWCGTADGVRPVADRLADPRPLDGRPEDEPDAAPITILVHDQTPATPGKTVDLSQWLRRSLCGGRPMTLDARQAAMEWWRRAGLFWYFARSPGLPKPFILVFPPERGTGALTGRDAGEAVRVRQVTVLCGGRNATAAEWEHPAYPGLNVGLHAAEREARIMVGKDVSWKNVPKPPPRDPFPKPGQGAEWEAARRAEREHYEASRPPRDAVTVELLDPEIVQAAFDTGPKWAASIVAGRIFDRSPRTCRDAARVPWPEDPLWNAILRLAFAGTGILDGPQTLSGDDT